jgi:hypothetical protein
MSGARLACPHCGFSPVARDREREIDVDFLDGERVSTRKGRILRVTCRAPGCGRNGTLRSAADVAAEREVRDHVARRVFALGQTGAHEETGLARATVQRHVEAWASAREADVRAASPGFLMVAHGRLRKRDAILLGDADRRTLVEVLDGIEALPAWLAHPGRTPALRACIPLDARVRDAIAQILPSARVMIAPSVGVRAVRSLGLRALGALRRAEHGRGSNGFPRQGEFLQSLASPTDTGGWPRAALGLLAAVKGALSILGSPDRRAGEALWPMFEAAALEPAARVILGLMREWRGALLEGLDHRHLDAASRLLDAVRRGLAGRRPALGFADLRRYALLRSFETRIEGAGWVATARGVGLAGLADGLSPAA